MQRERRREVKTVLIVVRERIIAAEREGGKIFKKCSVNCIKAIC